MNYFNLKIGNLTYYYITWKQAYPLINNAEVYEIKEESMTEAEHLKIRMAYEAPL